MKCFLGISDFLELISSLSHSVVFTLELVVTREGHLGALGSALGRASALRGCPSHSPVLGRGGQGGGPTEPAASFSPRTLRQTQPLSPAEPCGDLRRERDPPVCLPSGI